MSGRIKIKSAERQNSAYNLPVIGKVKVGEKKISTSGSEYPSGLDYFRLTGKYAEQAIKALSTDKPTKIAIYFTDDNFRKVCNERFEARDDKGVVVLEGDGEVFRAYNPEEKKWEEGIDAQHALVKRYRKLIRHVLTIRFLIADFRGVLGQWELTTKGTRTSIDRIINPFDAMLQMAGRVRGIPFDLTVEMVKSKTVEGVVRRFPVVSLIPNLSAESVEALGRSLGEMQKGFSLLNDEKIKQLAGADNHIPALPATEEQGECTEESLIPKGEHTEFNQPENVTDDRASELYNSGWKDCADGNDKKIFGNEVLQKAYNAGWKDYILANEVADQDENSQLLSLDTSAAVQATEEVKEEPKHEEQKPTEPEHTEEKPAELEILAQMERENLLTRQEPPAEPQIPAGQLQGNLTEEVQPVSEPEQVEPEPVAEITNQEAPKPEFDSFNVNEQVQNSANPVKPGNKRGPRKGQKVDISLFDNEE